MKPSEGLSQSSTDHQILQELMAESSIFQSHPMDGSERRWRWVFRGIGHRQGTERRLAVDDDHHEIEVSLPDDGSSPPTLRFITPLFHPAVSEDGVTTIRDLGLDWESSLGLDVLCERVWDVLRGAILPDVCPPRCPTAGLHLASLSPEQRLLDSRPLRDRLCIRITNLFRYQLLDYSERLDRCTEGLDSPGGRFDSRSPSLGSATKTSGLEGILFLDATELPKNESLDTGIIFIDEHSGQAASEEERR